MADREQILQRYNISDEFAEEWVEPKEFEEPNIDETGGLSKYALLRQLVGTDMGSSEMQVQDEADPLGSTDTVIGVVQSRGIDVEDPSKRGQYLISSSRFNAKVFLRDVHSQASYMNLLNSLDYLESSIQERSEALRYMVESDYDRFVKSKSLLDSVLDQINGSGFNHDNEWGLHHMTRSIDDANSKLTVIMKPVIENQSREQRLKAALELIKKNKYLFNLPSAISKHIKNKDHDSLIRDYRRGKDMRYNEDISADLPDYIMENKKITDRIWREVESIVDDYKQDCWKQLSNVGPEGNYMAVISKLLELGVEDNPIHAWINCQIEKFNEETSDKFEKLMLRTNLMRSNLQTLPPSESSSFVLPVKELSRLGETPTLCDSAEVVEMWLTIKRVLDDITQTSTKACMFWKSCAEFLDGTRQRNLPTGYQGQSKVHLSFSSEEVERIKQSGRQMIGLFAEKIVKYFESPAPTDPRSKRNSKSGQEESFLFLPPYANAMGAVRYLSHVLASLANSLQILSQANISSQASDSLRTVLSKIRERCINAVCQCWKEDSRKFALLEDWSTSANKTRTAIPDMFKGYQLAVLEGLRNIVYFSGNEDNTERMIVANPSTRLLNNILSNFLSSSSHILESLTSLLPMGDPQLDNSTSARDELTPEERTGDSKVLLLLSNISAIRDNVLPALYKYFESHFNIPTRDVAYALRDSMDKMDHSLFDLYTYKKRINLAEEIRSGIVDNPAVDWTAEKEPHTISPYIYECLLLLVIVHSKVNEVSSNLVPRVIVVLNDHVIKQILTGLREVEHFGNGGMLQAVADIEFWRMIMAKFVTAEAQNSIQLIYGTLKENSAVSWDTRSGPRPYVQHVIEHSGQESRLDFACFHK